MGILIFSILPLFDHYGSIATIVFDNSEVECAKYVKIRKWVLQATS